MFFTTLHSCKTVEELTHHEKPVPSYTTEKAIENKLMGPQNIPLPADTSKTIIVYNVVEQERKKSLVSDETIRLLIADLFGTITTILTLRSIAP